MASKEPVIVAAVGVAASHARSGNVSLAKAIEAAMSAAVTECMEAGELDPDKQRAAMLAAREQVKADFKQAEAEASAAEAERVAAEESAITP